MNILEVEGLTVRLTAHPGHPTILEDVSLRVSPGEVLGIVGESGSGKSMLALSIMGLLPPALAMSARRIALLGNELTGQPREAGTHFAAGAEDQQIAFEGAQGGLISFAWARKQVFELGFRLDKGHAAMSAGYYTARRNCGRVLGANDLTRPFGRGEAEGMAITGAAVFCSRPTLGETWRRTSRVASMRSMCAISARSLRVAKVEAVPPAPARPVRPTR